MKKLLFIFVFAIVSGIVVYSQNIGKTKISGSSNKAVLNFMEGRKEHNAEKILKFFGKTDSVGIAIHSFYLKNTDNYKIKNIKKIDTDTYNIRKGDVAYTVRLSNDNFTTCQDFWYLLRLVNKKWICVSYYAIGIEDDDEFYDLENN